MMKPEAESAEMELRSGNMLEVLEALRGCIVFVKTMLATNAYMKDHTCNGLKLPPWFVERNGEMLCKDVVLLTNKAHWDLKLISIARSREVPGASFCGGWKAFAVSNNLAEGDHLLFKLSGKSQFDVYMFNPDGTPKTEAPPNEAPMNRSEASELPEEKEKGESSDRRQEHLAAEGRKEFSANRLCGLFAKEETRELPDEQEKDADAYDKDHGPREKQKSHPSFCKRLAASNFSSGSSVTSLEFPADFARTHGGHLRTLVMLQGISQESPVYTIACSWGQDRSKTLRLFLRYGWMEFCDANNLKVEQELEFTLTSDSFFVVREIAS